MKTHAPLFQLALVATFTVAAPAQADTTVYAFSGLYNIAGGTQGYSGSFSIIDPLQTAERPPMAPDVTSPTYAAIWAGTSLFYTGAAALSITFASGTTVTAPMLYTVVNNTTYSGAGAPYPMGLSVQLYPTATTITAPTTDVCDTPTGVCGPDDDPLYHDATQAALMNTTGVYFAFWLAPLAASPGVPNLATAFGASRGGLGIFSVQNGLNTTTLTGFNGLTATVTPSLVPEPGTALSMVAGLLALAAGAQRSRSARVRRRVDACAPAPLPL